MKIIEIIPNLHPGGAEKLVVDLTNEFSRRGNECTVVTLFDLGSQDIFKSFVDKSVKIHSLGKRLGFDLKCLYHLCKYVYAEKPDIVHAHTNSISYLILIALLHRKTKYFATIHSDAKVEAGSGLHRIIRKFLFKCKLVTPITISEESELSFKKFYGRDGYLIINGCSQFKPTRNDGENEFKKNVDFLFAHVASIQPSKNQITLVKAFNKLLNDGIKARLLLLGRNANEEIFQELKTYFSDNIVYLGEQKNPRDFVNICDAFCLSSLWEGMPISIIEAFSVGCPPITTPVGGCVNMIKNGVNGILAEGTNEDEYYQALKRFVILDEQKRVELSKNALKSYKEIYSIERTASEHIKLFTLNS